MLWLLIVAAPYELRPYATAPSASTTPTSPTTTAATPSPRPLPLPDIVSLPVRHFRGGEDSGCL
ncbi:hypothetical protein GCM10009540_82740 [Streptomyces turgidiscabies]